MKKLVKIILTYTLKPYLEHVYLKSERNFHYDGLSMKIVEGIFHPGLFYSSKLFCRFLKNVPLKGSTLLDMGCGSGILSLVAARRGAKVTAVDINPVAVNITKTNAKNNRLTINTIQSDLFDQLEELFDFILVNPPYYSQKPNSIPDMAWYCGTSHDYFIKFFSQLSDNFKPGCRVYMILSDECDLKTIEYIANNHKFAMQQVLKRRFLIEENFIFKISRNVE